MIETKILVAVRHAVKAEQPAGRITHDDVAHAAHVGAGDFIFLFSEGLTVLVM